MAWGTLSRQARGYGKEWTKLRKLILERDKGLCQPSLRQGRVVIATEVDHIVSKAAAKKLGWTQAQIDHPNNLQAISKDEHLKKTKEEVGATYRPKVIYGLDGWPIENK